MPMPLYPDAMYRHKKKSKGEMNAARRCRLRKKHHTLRGRRSLLVFIFGRELDRREKIRYHHGGYNFQSTAISNHWPHQKTRIFSALLLNTKRENGGLPAASATYTS
jgi:hypothetical protein